MKKNTLKNKKGFTLTELIVVIVIIGILAAVLIPTLTGYINKAKESAAEQEAQSYVTAYQSWIVEKDYLTENKDFADYCKNELELTEGTVQYVADVDANTEGDQAGFKYTASNDYVVTFNSVTKKLSVAKPAE